MRLVEYLPCIQQYWNRVGIVEGVEGEDVLVRFGDNLILVPSEMLEGVEW